MILSVREQQSVPLAYTLLSYPGYAHLRLEDVHLAHENGQDSKSGNSYDLFCYYHNKTTITVEVFVYSQNNNVYPLFLCLHNTTNESSSSSSSSFCEQIL